MTKTLAMVVAVCVCGVASWALADGAVVTVVDIGEDDVAGLTQPIRAFPVPAAAGWAGDANLIYDNYAEGLGFSSSHTEPQVNFNWLHMPLANDAVTVDRLVHDFSWNVNTASIAIDNADGNIYTNMEGSDTDDPDGSGAPPDKRWPYHIPRPGGYCMADYSNFMFDLADDTGTLFGVFMPYHSNTWSDTLGDDANNPVDGTNWWPHNYVPQYAHTVDIFIHNVGDDWTTAEHLQVNLDTSGDQSGSYCPFLMIEDADGIDAVSIIHNAGAWGWPTYGFMDVYSDVGGAGPGCLMGDANGDGEVGIADLSALADNYGKTNATWRMGDFNDDGIVGIADLSALADNYGNTGDPCDPDAMIVPEPITLVMLTVGGLLLRKKR